MLRVGVDNAVLKFGGFLLWVFFFFMTSQPQYFQSNFFYAFKKHMEKIV